MAKKWKKEYRKGGLVDNIRAWLTAGEYVIRKSSVEKKGTDFLQRLNAGQIGGYAKGGAVSLGIRGPKVPKRESYIDENEYGDVTKYRQIKPGYGIDKRMSGFARENDPMIKKYFE